MNKPVNPQTVPSLESLDPATIILNSSDFEIIRGNQGGYGAWLQSPAQLILLTATDERLAKVSGKRGRPTNRVEKIRAAVVKGTKILYIFPADDEDPDAITIHRYGSVTIANLITILSPTKLTVPSGRRYRYTVKSEDESPVGPALMIDMGKVLERVSIKAKKRKSTDAEQPEAAPIAANVSPVPAKVAPVHQASTAPAAAPVPVDDPEADSEAEG